MLFRVNTKKEEENKSCAHSVIRVLFVRVQFSLNVTHALPRRAVAFSWWGIVYLNDPDSYAGWSFYTPGRASQARQVEG